ncbi:hypothetical protein Peur_018511 [Populus x canadensis]
MVQFLEDKTILVTGATGFLAKSVIIHILFVPLFLSFPLITAWMIISSLAMINAIFMEKMLRVQPNVKKIYLLSRAPGAKHDVALGINTVRAENVICFAKKSVKLKVLVRIYIYPHRLVLMFNHFRHFSHFH